MFLKMDEMLSRICFLHSENLYIFNATYFCFMKLRLLTILSFSAALAFATASCGNDDDNNTSPGTTSGTTSSSTSGTTASTTSGTTSGTTGSGTLSLGNSTSNSVEVQCTNDAGGLFVEVTADNGNTCSIVLGSVPNNSQTYNIIDGADPSGTVGPQEALILARTNNGLDLYGSTSGVLEVSINGAVRQISFANITMQPEDTTKAPITATATFVCQ